MYKIWSHLAPAKLRRYFERGNHFRKVVSNTGWLLGDKIIRGGGGLAVTVYIGRYLGPEHFGVYNFALAFVAIFGVLPALGLEGIAIRNVVKDPERRYQYLGGAFFLKLLAGVLTFLVIVMINVFSKSSHSVTSHFIMIISAGYIFQSFDVIDFWFQSQVQSRFTVISRSGAFIIIAVFKIMLIIIRAPLLAFAWAGLAEIILGAGGLLVTYRLNHQWISNWRFSLMSMKSMLRDSWPLILSGAILTLFYRIDQVMLAALSGYENVGIYTSAFRLVEIWNFIPLIILSSLYPAMIKYKAEDHGKFITFTQKIFNLFFVASILIVVFVGLFSRFIVIRLFGAPFEPAAVPLVILATSSIFNFSAAIRAQIFLINNQTIYHTYCVVFGVVSMVVLNLLLIPKWGTAGAATATSISCFVSGYLTSFIYRPIRYIGKMQTEVIFFRWNKVE